MTPPSSDLPKTGHPDPRDATVAQLEADLAALRASLQESARQCEHAMAELQRSEERFQTLVHREELLHRNERLASLGTLLAGVAHELNNPLAAIAGFSELLLQSELDEEDHAAVTTIRRETHRAATIVRDLLTFARPQTSGAREWINVNEVIEHMLVTQHYAMETHGIVAEAWLAPGLPLLYGQRQHIEQIVLNLLVNARQALEPISDATPAPRRSQQPCITIRTTTAAARIVLEISDNGPGIPLENRSRIWDPFFTTKAVGAGTGLGLAVVHGIVTGCGGTIEARSGDTPGATFIVTLPILGAAAADPQPEVSPPAGTDVASAPDDGAATTTAAPPATATGTLAATALDVLVVVRGGDARRSIGKALTRRGHAVLSAAGSADGIRVAEHSNVDRVIVGAQLGAVDALEFLSRLRALPAYLTTRCVVLSSRDDPRFSADPNVVVMPAPDAPADVDELCQTVEHT